MDLKLSRVRRTFIILAILLVKYGNFSNVRIFSDFLTLYSHRNFAENPKSPLASKADPPGTQSSELSNKHCSEGLSSQ